MPYLRLSADKWKGLLLGGLLLILALEIIWLAPVTLTRWHAFDYENYRQAGQLLLRGENPYGPHRYYPLPTILWVFVPLALLPDGFRLFWVMGGFVSALFLHRERAWLFLLFPPLWIVIRDGMLEGWLLLPLALLLSNRTGWAGLAAALLLFKPQLALFPIVYVLFHWLQQRDWRNLLAFSVSSLLLFGPSFWIMPDWPAQMLSVLSQRADQTLTQYPGMTASLWAWRIFGFPGWVWAFLLLGISLILFGQAWQRPEHRAQALLALGLLLNPILFTSSLILLIPLFTKRAEILSLLALSWLAAGLEITIGHFDGGFSFLPLFALWQLARR